MILDFLREFGDWTWFIVGFLLLALEILAPGFVFLWFGVAAILTGAVGLVVPTPWQVDVLIFVVLSAVLVLAGRRFFSRSSERGERPFLNERAAGLIGTTYVLDEPIVDGHGSIRVGDSRWNVSGPDLPVGARVRVAKVDGARLTVERADDAAA